VVCIVSDGRLKINARTRSVLAALGVYQDGVGKNVVNGKPVVGRTLLARISTECLQTAHLYEYTTQCEPPTCFVDGDADPLCCSGHQLGLQDQTR